MDIKKGLDSINQKLQNLPNSFRKLPTNNKIAWVTLLLGIILIIIALLIW